MGICGLRSPKARKGVCSHNSNVPGFYAQSYPTTIAYPTLETESIGVKKLVQTLFLFQRC
jgi:hypothetical protein